jgi:hypothetical protein
MLAPRDAISHAPSQTRASCSKWLQAVLLGTVQERACKFTWARGGCNTDADAGALAAGTVTMGCRSQFFITPIPRPSRPPALGGAAADPTVLLGDRCNALQGQSCAHLGCAEPVVELHPVQGRPALPATPLAGRPQNPRGSLVWARADAWLVPLSSQLIQG